MTVAEHPMKDRLTRLDRIYEKDPIFFITCCTPERKKTLANDSIHHSFQNFCQSAKERHIFVDRYVIMPDHLHFFLHLAESMKLSIWIKSLKNSLSKTLRESGIMAPIGRRVTSIISCARMNLMRRSGCMSGSIRSDRAW
jgi:REP element-mobilizing transposase RayT